MSLQIVFWIVSFVLLNTILYLNGQVLGNVPNPDIDFVNAPMLLAAICLGWVYGIALGLMDWVLDYRFSPRASMGLVILIRVLFYYLVILLAMILIRYVFLEQILFRFYYPSVASHFDNFSWGHFYSIILVYSFAVAPVIGFINQMNKKFGPGILPPMLLGRFRKPVEQQRLFIFVDMKSSTTYAERLGHLRYSSLIQDCFGAINDVIIKYRAEVYQYVGDGMIISWKILKAFRADVGLDCFFEYQEALHKKRKKYLQKYGFVPEFKAGMHAGTVTMVEVGDIKRELAYHGDVLNTASRIQDVCNEYRKDFLLSQSAMDLMDVNSNYTFYKIGGISLKGKDVPVQLFSVKPS